MQILLTPARNFYGKKEMLYLVPSCEIAIHNFHSMVTFSIDTISVRNKFAIL